MSLFNLDRSQDKVVLVGGGVLTLEMIEKALSRTPVWSAAEDKFWADYFKKYFLATP